MAAMGCLWQPQVAYPILIIKIKGTPLTNNLINKIREIHFKLILLMQWLHMPMATLYPLWFLIRQDHPIRLPNQDHKHHTTVNNFGTFLVKVKAVEEQGTIWWNGLLVNDFLPSWIIFFHLTPTWFSDLYVIKNYVFCGTADLPKTAIRFFNH